MCTHAASSLAPTEAKSAHARNALAMDWLDKYEGDVQVKATFTSIVEKVQAVRLVARSSNEARRAAIALAHMVLGAFPALARRIGGLDPVQHYQHAP